MRPVRRSAGLVLGAIIATFTGVAVGDVRYVDDDAPPGGNGQAWNTAFQYLQDALAVAGAGDEIRVAQGLYKPDQSETGVVVPGDRLASFGMQTGLALLGGYAGLADPNHPDDRDPALYETVLTGDLLGNDGPNFANNGDNSRHVVTAAAAGPSARLDGLTITAGNADGDPANPGGGGILCTGAAPTIAYCSVVANCAATGAPGTNGGAGGGIHCRDSDLTLLGSVIHMNQAGRGGDELVNGPPRQVGNGGNGGGVSCAAGSLTLVGCDVTSNRSGAGGSQMYASGTGGCGGGVYASGGLNAIECTFHENAAGNGGNAESSAGAGGTGGAAYSASGASSFTNSVVQGNQAGTGGTGGGGGGSGGGIYCGGTLTLDGCTVAGNGAGSGGSCGFGGGGGGSGGSGGGVSVAGALTGQNCVISGNVCGGGGGGGHSSGGAGGSGGGVFSGSGTSSLAASVVSDNHAGGGGPGATWGASGGSGGSGGGLHFGGALTLTACTISYSTAGGGGPGWEGAGASGAGGGVYAAQSLTAEDCNLHNNTAGDGASGGYDLASAPGGSGGGIRCASGDCSLTHCTFAGNRAGDGGGGQYDWWGADGGHGGAVCSLGASPLTLGSCTLENNRAGHGGTGRGGGNGGNGGAISAEKIMMWNSLALSNGAGHGGDGLLYSAGNGGSGGAIDTAPLDASMALGSTLASNTAGQGGSGSTPGQPGAGGAVRSVGGFPGFGIVNSVVWSNTAPSDPQLSGSITAFNCCIEGGWTGPGHDNIAANPLFVDSGNGDLRLQLGSPCIDVGTNAFVPPFLTTDLDGLPRILDGDGDGTATVDMGAYEASPDCNANGVPDVLETTSLPVLLVCSRNTHSVLAFYGATGQFLPPAFAPAGAAGLGYPNGLAVDGLGQVYVSSEESDTVIRYANQTGLPNQVYSGGGLDGPVGLVIREPDTLLVASYYTGSVLAFNLQSGAFMHEFVAPGSGGLQGPGTLLRTPTGNLLVASENSDQVLEYDPNGSFVRVAASGAGLHVPTGIVLDTDGNLVVGNFTTGNVLRFRPNGTFLDVFLPAGSGGLGHPHGLAWGANGHLFICDRYGARVLEFTDSGTFVGVFAAGGGLSEPTCLAWGTLRRDCNGNEVPDDCDLGTGTSLDVNQNNVPDECESWGDLNCDGAISFDDINPFIDALSDPLGYQQQYPDCNLLNADCSNDGVVDFDDINPFVELLSGG